MVRFETKKCGEIGKLMWFKSSDLKKIKSIYRLYIHNF